MHRSVPPFLQCIASWQPETYCSAPRSPGGGAGQPGSAPAAAPSAPVVTGIPTFGRLSDALTVCITTVPGSTAPLGPSKERPPPRRDPFTTARSLLISAPQAGLHHHGSSLPPPSGTRPQQLATPPPLRSPVLLQAVAFPPQAPPPPATPLLRMDSPPPLLDCIGDWDDGPWDHSLFHMSYDVPVLRAASPCFASQPSATGGWGGSPFEPLPALAAAAASPPSTLSRTTRPGWAADTEAPLEAAAEETALRWRNAPRAPRSRRKRSPPPSQVRDANGRSSTTSRAWCVMRLHGGRTSALCAWYGSASGPPA